jgi:hypothetical protein
MLKLLKQSLQVLVPEEGTGYNAATTVKRTLPNNH